MTAPKRAGYTLLGEPLGELERYGIYATPEEAERQACGRHVIWHNPESAFAPRLTWELWVEPWA